MGRSDLTCAFCFAPPLFPSVVSVVAVGSRLGRVRQRSPTATKTATTCVQPPRTRRLLTALDSLNGASLSHGLIETRGSVVHSSNSSSRNDGKTKSRRDVGVRVVPFPRRIGKIGYIVGRRSAHQAQKAIVDARSRKKWTEVLEVLDWWEADADKLDAKTYNIALAALSKSGRWREAIAVLDRMRLNGVLPDVYSMNGAISACGRAGKWQQALDLIGQMEEEGSGLAPDVFSYNGAINGMAKDNGRWREALDLLVKMEARGLTPDVVTYTTLMCACDRAGEWQYALDIMDVMRERNVVPNIISYGTAISSCARCGNWQRALLLLEEMSSREFTPNTVVYGSAIHACVVGGEPRRALALLDEMVNRGVVPDAAAFTAGMRAADGWASALRLLEAMKRHGVMPDLVAYNVALSVVARSGREDVALAILERMRKDGVCPDLVSFNTAIDACATSEKWQEAVKILEVDMACSKVQPDVITFTSVIHSCAGPRGNWEKAYELLDRMYQDEKGAKPNKNTYDLVMQACGYGGEWELAMTLLDDMCDLGIKLDTQTFNIAISACARSGQWLAAETLAASMPTRGVTPDSFTYTSVVAACARAGEWKRAKEVFDRERYVHRMKPSLQMYDALLSCLAAAGQWADVLLYFDRMVADGVVPDAAATVKGVLAAAQLGDGLRALSLLDGKKWVGESEDTNDISQNPLALPMSDGKDRPRRSTSEGIGALQDCIKGQEAAAGTQEVEGGVGSRPVFGPGGWEAMTPGFLSTLLHALDGEKQDVVVLETIERAREKGIVLNSSIYRCALKACGNLGNYTLGSILLSQMREEKLTPDIIHWNHALRTTTASAQWQRAHLHLQTMKAAGVEPDEFSYAMALKACSAGLWSGNSWDEVDAWGTQDKISSTSSLHQCNIVEGRRRKQEEAQDILPCRGRYALQLLGEMDASGIRVCEQCLSLAMAACLEGHRDVRFLGHFPSPPARERWLSEAALSLFDRLLRTGATPSTTSYALALKACARTGNANRASTLFLSMMDQHPTHASVRNIPKSSSKVLQFAVGRLPEQLSTLEVRPWHLASAIAAYDAAGDWVGAMRLWEEAMRRGVMPCSPGYSAAIAAASRAGDLNAAFRLKEEATARRQALEARAFRLLCKACESQGEHERAAVLLEDARLGKLVVQ